MFTLESCLDDCFKLKQNQNGNREEVANINFTVIAPRKEDKFVTDKDTLPQAQVTTL